MKYQIHFTFTFVKQFVHRLVNSSKKWYYDQEWRDQMGKKLYPKNLRMLKPYVNETVYETLIDDPVWSEYAATCLFSEIDTVYHITERVTPEWLRAIDDRLQKDDHSLKEMLDKELMKVFEKYKRYESEKKTPEYEQRKREYEQEWERWSNES